MFDLIPTFSIEKDEEKPLKQFVRNLHVSLFPTTEVVGLILKFFSFLRSSPRIYSWG